MRNRSTLSGVLISKIYSGFPTNTGALSLFKLTTNYRSTPEILYLANSIIANNRKQFHKELHAVVSSGESPSVVPLRDIFEQAAFVTSVVMDLNMDSKSFDEIAVLYRSHYQSMELQMEFQRRGVPFEVRSGLKFFEQAHIKDVLSFLKVLVNPHDEISWKRIVKLVPGIGNITAGKIWDLIRTDGKSDRPDLRGSEACAEKGGGGFQSSSSICCRASGTRSIVLFRQRLSIIFSGMGMKTISILIILTQRCA